MSLRDDVARAIDAAFHNPASSDDWSDEVAAALAVVRRHIKALMPQSGETIASGLHDPVRAQTLAEVLALLNEDAP